MLVRKPVRRLGSSVVHFAMVPIGTAPGSIADHADAYCGATLRGNVVLMSEARKVCPRCLKRTTDDKPTDTQSVDEKGEA